MKSQLRARLCGHGMLRIAFVAISVVLFVAVLVGVAGAAPGEQLKNQGFEDSLDHLNYWETTGTAVALQAEVLAEVLDEYGNPVMVGPPTPGGGGWMLRLGAPKDKDTHQLKGVVRARQAFRSDGSDITLAYRIFTWEHRSGDTFAIEVTDAEGTPVPVTWSVDDPTQPDLETTNATSYVAPMQEPAKPSKYWYSVWRDVTISGLPAGVDLVLSYALNNPRNASHDTWVYIDHRIVVDFTWAPSEVIPHEGDAVGLYADPSLASSGDEIAAWEWRINKDGQTQIYNSDNYSNSPVGFIVPHDEGEYSVTLAVTDSSGAEHTSDTKAIFVQNYAPRVNALGVIEVLADGTPAELVGRFLDPGWRDVHTATWSMLSNPERSVAGQVSEDDFAPIRSGYVGGGPVTAADAGSWSLTLDDGDGGISTDQFTVLTVDDDPDRFEDRDSFPAVHTLTSDGAYLSYIQSQGDIDIFEVRLADGDGDGNLDALPAGTELLVTLRDLPADYDLIVLENAEASAESVQSAPFMNSPFMNSPFMNSPFMNSAYMNSPFMNSPFMNSPFMNSPFMNSPFMNSPFMNSPFMNSPFMNSPFMNSPFMNSPFATDPPSVPTGWTWLDGYPLSLMSFTGAANDNTSGMDISFNELGFEHEGMENLRVLGFSANIGTEPEVVLATADYPQTTGVVGQVYVAVKSATGAYSDRPYTLQIETSRPFDVVALDHRAQNPLVTGATSWEPLPNPATPRTLFVTQFDRLEALYSADGGGQRVKDALVEVAGLSQVAGKVISVPASLFDSWDRQPWLVEEANNVAHQIRGLIQAELVSNPSIEWVVLVGNDRIIPFRRLIDQTIIGNEQSYADQSFLVTPSATLSSIANGCILTDDFYVDETPIGWNGSFLYVPDVPISRLVEMPTEIEKTTQAFKTAVETNGGELALAVGLVSGYDFMTDGAERVRDILGATNVLISETWTGQELWDALMSDIDAASISAHFTHFAGLSAWGYELYEDGLPFGIGELLLGRDVASGGGDSSRFEGSLLFSMGCHAGLNIPDEQTVSWASEDPTNPALDLPQAMMSQGAVYLGSTGYGYGDTVGEAGTEALVRFLAERLVGGADSVGRAVAEAKRDYLSSLSTLTPYDQKSSVQFVLYGMPQYQLPAVGATTQAAHYLPAPIVAASSEATLPPGASFRLSLSEKHMIGGDWLFLPYPPIEDYSALSLRDVSTDVSTGQYIDAGGRFEATADRPIHPVVPVPLDPRPEGPVHGFVYTDGTYPVELASFNPAISRLTYEWEVGGAEFQVGTSEFWPVEPGVLTTIDTRGGYDQTFIAVPAQFKPTGTDGLGSIVGTERVWESLDVEVLRSATPAGYADDWLPPSVPSVEFWKVGDSVVVSVEAYDSSGISRIVALQLDAEHMRLPMGGDQAFSTIPESGRYVLTLDMPGVDPADVSLFIQVVDGYGNVTTLTGRGATVRWPLETGWGLQNPGFEEGEDPLGLDHWVVSEPAIGSVVVIPLSGDGIFSNLGEWNWYEPIDLPEGDEGKGEYEGSIEVYGVGVVETTEFQSQCGGFEYYAAGYGEYSSLRVMPFSGTQMLRLGQPNDGNAHQEKGVTSVSQQFVSDGLEIVVAYRLISLDHRAFEDVFVVEVRDVYGNVVFGPEKVPNIPGDPYGDTHWQTMRISGLPAGKTFIITYSLNNTQSASHNTWVYVDQGR